MERTAAGRRTHPHPCERFCTAQTRRVSSDVLRPATRPAGQRCALNREFRGALAIPCVVSRVRRSASGRSEARVKAAIHRVRSGRGAARRTSNTNCCSLVFFAAALPPSTNYCALARAVLLTDEGGRSHFPQRLWQKIRLKPLCQASLQKIQSALKQFECFLA